MKKIIIPVIIVSMMTVFSGCTAVAGIGNAGAVVGIIAVIVVIAIISGSFTGSAEKVTPTKN